MSEINVLDLRIAIVGGSRILPGSVLASAVRTAGRQISGDCYDALREAMCVVPRSMASGGIVAPSQAHFGGLVVVMFVSNATESSR